LALFDAGVPIRSAVAGVAMGLVLYLTRESPYLWQIAGAVVSVLVYLATLFALRTFSQEEIYHAREGIGFISPFVASWAKKLKREES